MARSLRHWSRGWPGWDKWGRGWQSLLGSTCESHGPGRRGRSAWRAARQPPPACLSPLPRCKVGPESGSQRRRALVEAEKQFDHIHTIRTRWLGRVSETPLPACPFRSPSASQQTSSTTSLGIKVTLSPLPTSCQSFAPPHTRLSVKAVAFGSPCPFLPVPTALGQRPRVASPLLPGDRLQESQRCSLASDTGH